MQCSMCKMEVPDKDMEHHDKMHQKGSKDDGKDHSQGDGHDHGNM